MHICQYINIYIIQTHVVIDTLMRFYDEFCGGDKRSDADRIYTDSFELRSMAYNAQVKYVYFPEVNSMNKC